MIICFLALFALQEAPNLAWATAPANEIASRRLVPLDENDPPAAPANEIESPPVPLDENGVLPPNETVPEYHPKERDRPHYEHDQPRDDHHHRKHDPHHHKHDHWNHHHKDDHHNKHDFPQHDPDHKKQKMMMSNPEPEDDDHKRGYLSDDCVKAMKTTMDSAACAGQFSEMCNTKCPFKKMQCLGETFRIYDEECQKELGPLLVKCPFEGCAGKWMEMEKQCEADYEEFCPHNGGSPTYQVWCALSHGKKFSKECQDAWGAWKKFGCAGPDKKEKPPRDEFEYDDGGPMPPICGFVLALVFWSLSSCFVAGSCFMGYKCAQKLWRRNDQQVIHHHIAAQAVPTYAVPENPEKEGTLIV